MRYEPLYGRPMCIETVKQSGGVWCPSTNLAALFASKRAKPTGGQSGQESGKPDGFVRWRLNPELPAFFVDLEVKAFAGSVNLGDGEDCDETVGWSARQREYYLKWVLPTNGLYFIYLWAYPERNPAHVRHENALVYLVPAQAWLTYEASLDGRQEIGITPQLEREIKYRDRTIDIAFKPYQLVYTPGKGDTPRHFAVPPEHLIYRVTRRYS